MQPENQQYPTNYLDSIAVQPPVKTVNPIILWVMIGGVLALVVVVVLLVTSNGTSSTDKLRGFASRVSGLKTLTGEAQENIKSSDLRTTNSSLTLILTNANRDLQAPLTELEVNPEELKGKQVVIAQTEIDDMKSRLEDARLNAIYDRTYAREMAFYLKNLRTEMTALYDSTKSEELQEVLETTYTSLGPLEKSFSEFNET